LRAAIDLAEAGRVTVFTKAQITESNSMHAQGGIAAAIGENDHVENHYLDTVAAGAGLCDAAAVRVLVEEGPAEIDRLLRWGADFEWDGDALSLSREGGHGVPRIVHGNGGLTGKVVVDALLAQVRTNSNVTISPFTFFRDLIVDDARVAGIQFEHDGHIANCYGKATLLATGGGSQVYSQSTNPETATGDGLAAAYRAGAELRDMEFVQYHPTGLPFTGILITEAARAEGGYLINKDGYRYLQDYNLGTPQAKPVLRSMELGPRDRLSQAFVKEQEKGRTIAGPYGPVVHLDIRHLGEKVINGKLPFVRELCLKYQNIDPIKELIPVRPVVHYMMGGVHTNIEGATSLGGLFAAGEVACVSINGANRLGSNSLTELLVFGARAGKAAAAFASEQKEPDSRVIAQAMDEHLASVASRALLEHRAARELDLGELLLPYAQPAKAPIGDAKVVPLKAERARTRR